MQSTWLKLYPERVAHEISYRQFNSVSELVERTFHKFSLRPAVSCMGTTLSFRDVSQSVDCFAAFLQGTLGIKKGERVAIMLPNIIQFPIVELAVLKIGAVCVNTNPLYTPREMAHQFKDSGAKAIVILNLFTDKLESILGDCSIEHVVITSLGDQLPNWKAYPLGLAMRLKKLVPKHSLKSWSFKDAMAQGRTLKLAPVSVTGEDLAILQYTGGTTGVSKGAMLTHHNILANMLQVQEFVKPYFSEGHEVVLTALPLYHIFALTVNFLSFFSQGQHMILVPKPVPIANTSRIFKKHPVTVMTGVNTLFNSLNSCIEFKAISPRTLKVAIAGGMALQDHVSKTFQSITGTKITEGFGLTEASPATHVNPLRLDAPVGSIGIPLPSTDAKIVAESGEELPAGEIGELVVRGPQIMKGYWQRPEETAKVIRDGWLWTGDLARVNEAGYFFIVDRKKDMILVSGFNVYPNEVEEVIASHPKVLEAAVIGVKDDACGESVKAFVVKADPSLTEDEVRAYCKKQLVAYKVPRQIEFMTALPKSNVGKILRRELRDNPVGIST